MTVTKTTFMAALFTAAKIWAQSECPSTNEWINKDVVYIHSVILFSRNGGNSAIYSKIDEP